MLWDCLEQLITDKRGQLGRGVVVYQAVPGTAHRIWFIAHLSEGDLDNLFYPGSLIHQQDRY